MENIEIKCPKCGWHPDGQAYWKCSCGHVWDTFSTGGRCPKCTYVWEKTQCIAHAGGCNDWSPHLDWYVNLTGVVEKMWTEIKERDAVPTKA